MNDVRYGGGQSPAEQDQPGGDDHWAKEPPGRPRDRSSPRPLAVAQARVDLGQFPFAERTCLRRRPQQRPGDGLVAIARQLRRPAFANRGLFIGVSHGSLPKARFISLRKRVRARCS